MASTYYDKLPKEPRVAEDLLWGITAVALGIGTIVALSIITFGSFGAVAISGLIAGGITILKGGVAISSYAYDKYNKYSYQKADSNISWENDYKEQSRANKNLEIIAEQVITTLKECGYKFGPEIPFFSTKNIKASTLEALIREAIVSRNDISSVASLRQNDLYEVANQFAEALKPEFSSHLLTKDIKSIKYRCNNSELKIENIFPGKSFLSKSRDSMPEKENVSFTEIIKSRSNSQEGVKRGHL